MSDYTKMAAIVHEYQNPDVNADILPDPRVKDYSCPYCNAELDKAFEEPDAFAIGRRLSMCPACGWWAAEHETVERSIVSGRWHLSASVGSILTFEELSSNASLLEVRNYLCARWQGRKSVSPRMMEEVVTSVFRDQGFDALTTPYRDDGGIDSILIDKNGSRIGVQVKHTKNSIEVEALRSLTGALWLGGFAKGVFVTTSRFRSGAWKCADKAGAKGIPITLLDAEKFLDQIMISQRTIYSPPTNPLEYFNSLTPVRETLIGVE